MLTLFEAFDCYRRHYGLLVANSADGHLTEVAERRCLARHLQGEEGRYHSGCGRYESLAQGTVCPRSRATMNAKSRMASYSKSFYVNRKPPESIHFLFVYTAMDPFRWFSWVFDLRKEKLAIKINYSRWPGFLRHTVHMSVCCRVCLRSYGVF